MGLIDKFRQSKWNPFRTREPTNDPNYGSPYAYSGASYAYRPDRPRFTRGNERSLVTAVYNRIAIDVASLDIKHCELDDRDRFVKVIKSGLQNCLDTEANIDQTGRSLRQDITESLLDEGVIAIVPTSVWVDEQDEDETSPYESGKKFDVLSMRVGKILDWAPKHVRVQVYNEETGLKEDITLPKAMVSIVENPFYAIMNEPSSTFQRLIRKLNMLDVIDEQISSGKIDLLIQLPYTVRGDKMEAQADTRLKRVEEQLMGSTYGIAYIDATEHVTQLNRPIENNLLGQIQYLIGLMFSQLGITQSILDGSADEQTMLNYHVRTVEPIVSAIVGEMKRKFISRESREHDHESIMFFRDPFKLVPITQLDDLADKLTRNAIVSSNEVRQGIGMVPSQDPKADELSNKNLNDPKVSSSGPKDLPPEDPKESTA